LIKIAKGCILREKEGSMDNTRTFKIDYDGSLFWLIFWLIVFFPIAFVLFLTAVSFRAGASTYHITYDGSRFWLGFWVLVFFPVAFVLLFVNGLKVKVD
jgi:hypothetical protein